MSNDLESYTNDIESFENNTSQLRVLILFIDNYKLVNVLKNKITVKNNSNNELINHIQNIAELKDHKIQYLLNFTIEKSKEELENLSNAKEDILSNANDDLSNYYQLKSIPNLNTLNNTKANNTKANDTKANDTKLLKLFTNINSIIVVANKEKKYYIESKNISTKKNSSRKKRN